MENNNYSLDELLNVASKTVNDLIITHKNDKWIVNSNESYTLKDALIKFLKQYDV